MLYFCISEQYFSAVLALQPWFKSYKCCLSGNASGRLHCPGGNIIQWWLPGTSIGSDTISIAFKSPLRTVIVPPVYPHSQGNNSLIAMHGYARISSQFRFFSLPSSYPPAAITHWELCTLPESPKINFDFSLGTNKSILLFVYPLVSGQWRLPQPKSAQIKFWFLLVIKQIAPGANHGKVSIFACY